MKKIKGLSLLLIVVLLIMTACKAETDSIQESTQPNETPAVEEEDTASGASEYVLPADIIRSDSTVLDDSKTKKIITSQESYQIDTRITISIYADQEAPKVVFDEIFYTIDRLEKIISKTIEGSDVYNINQNAGIEPVKVSDDVWTLINQGLIYSNESKGKFDMSIGPIVDLWGINTVGAHVPDQSEIDNLLPLVNYENIILDEANQSVFLKEKGMEIDLGAIAKGYIADEVKKVILKEGYENAIINLGGNVLTVGTKPNYDYWTIGVKDPNINQTAPIGLMHLNDNSIVTSGVYERFFIEDGVRYHHIINPDTGYPEQNHLQSITIISNKSIEGDGLSTTLFMMGLDAGYEYANTHEGLEAVFVTDDNKIYLTDGLKDNFTLNANNYEIVSK